MVEKDSQKIGNVIRITDSRTLIVNVGKDTLTVGDNIKVYESIDALRDLDGSDLCIFEYTKDVLEVIETDEYYSICQKKKTRTSTTMQQLALSPLLSMQKTEYIPLKVIPEEIDPLEPKDPTIHVGDPVKLA